MRLGRLELFEHKAIGEPDAQGCPLLHRWKLVAWSGGGGLYVHRFMRSDYDRALHDHPWSFRTLILAGGYEEEYMTPTGERRRAFRAPGSLLYRPARWAHRVILPARERPWGFLLPGGWCWWRKHNAASNICETEIQHHEGGD